MSLKKFSHKPLPKLRAALAAIAIIFGLAVIISGALTSTGATASSGSGSGTSSSPSPTPSPGATPSPTPNATPTPNASPTPGPSPSPSPTPGASPTPAPTPGGNIEIEAPLVGAPINGVAPTGRAKFEIEFGNREFEVEVRDVNLAQGASLRILIDGADVGSLTLDGQQRGRFRLKTEDGQSVPDITSRTRVVVTDQAGATLLAGSFSASPPQPAPTPLPTPTPGTGGEVRVESKLAGAPINGLTPKGEAEFRLQDGGRRRIKVEVEKVNLPSGTILRVFVDNLSIGQIALNSRLEGRLELDTENGQIVPHLQGASSIVVMNQAGATVVSSVFNRPVAPIAASNDIDDASFFVEQQYKDFLDREPDDSGLRFWVNQIAQCGADASCASVARVNTSGAFFLSIEFQQTGYLLYRFQKASFGTLPRRNEFLVDMQRAARGVVVGSAGWEQTLEANKRALAEDWVARPAFRAVFDGMNSRQFVDALFQRAAVTPAQAERDALTAGLDAGAETRATVLRKVAEHPTFSAKESNPAFVLMQYFGYLHRNPDEGPDANLDGFNFWLQKLNSHGGDFRKAEMVRAFISSGEYRSRFRW